MIAHPTLIDLSAFKVHILLSLFLKIYRETKDPRVSEEQVAHLVQRYVYVLAHVSLQIVIDQFVTISP